MRKLPGPRVLKRDRRTFAASAFMVAFAARMFWATRVQSPFGALYSDMGGYVLRAQGMLDHTLPSDPRINAIWPWGTHAIVAVELLVFGRNHPDAIAALHALVGAVPAACAVLLAARFTRSRFAVASAGFVVAFWHPLVIYSGFFSSEIWFAAAIGIMTLLLAHVSEGRRGALGAGVALAIAFVVRPQVLASCALIVVAAIVFRRRMRIDAKRIALFVIPLVLAVGVSAYRLHSLTGRWGLIASYEPVQRLFGSTDIRRIDASWNGPKGERWSWWFAPHTRPASGKSEAIRFEGFVTDAEILGEFRRERVAKQSLGSRLARMGDNLSFLVVDDLPWPEDDFKKPPFRPMLQKIFAKVALVLSGLAFVGLAFLRRHRTLIVVLLAHFATLVATAAVYLPEARYRVPYDPLLVVVAVVGVAGVIGRVRAYVVARHRRVTSGGEPSTSSVPESESVTTRTRAWS